MILNTFFFIARPDVYLCLRSLPCDISIRTGQTESFTNKHNSMRCGVVWCCVVWCDMVFLSAVCYAALVQALQAVHWCSAVRCGII